MRLAGFSFCGDFEFTDPIVKDPRFTQIISISKSVSVKFSPMIGLDPGWTPLACMGEGCSAGSLTGRSSAWVLGSLACGNSSCELQPAIRMIIRADLAAVSLGEPGYTSRSV